MPTPEHKTIDITNLGDNDNDGCNGVLARNAYLCPNPEIDCVCPVFRGLFLCFVELCGVKIAIFKLEYSP